MRFLGGSVPAADSPFVYMGSANEGSACWELFIPGGQNRVRFAVASNNIFGVKLDTAYTFTAGRWYQVVLNYAPTNLALFINGILVTNQVMSPWLFPSALDRANGLVIGNDVSGNRPIGGQFDEIETFNYPLTSTEISANFQRIQSMDTDLNGVPDLLEDIALSSSAPFTGVPMAVTGVIEAEQFDRGGKGVAYNTTDLNYWTNDYRPSQIEITNCTDLGGGYCVNNLRAGEWLKYTLDVRVGQNYAVDSRIAGMASGGVYKVEFYQVGASTAYVSTANLTIPTTNWTNIVQTLLPLQAGSNIMKFSVLTNAPGTNTAARLNYISIYPSWIEGATNLLTTNNLTLDAYDSSATSSMTWTNATNNAAKIQAAIDTTANGVVLIPQGTYMIAQRSPDDAADANKNSAVFVTHGNVEVRGVGKTNTTLLLHNRSTTAFFIGKDKGGNAAPCTNLTFRELGIEGRPHWRAASPPTSPAVWEEGCLYTVSDAGTLVAAGLGLAQNKANINILLTNCLFRNAGIGALRFIDHNTNIAVRNCEFWERDKGTNGGLIGHTTTLSDTTSNFWWTSASIFGRPGGAVNVLVMNNLYNGSPSMTNVNTDYESLNAADGLVWGQSAANWFVGENLFTNYALEAIQLNAGPAAAAQNAFDTKVSTYSTEALNISAVWVTASATASPADNAYGFVGNSIIGGRHGARGGEQGSTPQAYQLSFCGNLLNLYPALLRSDDYPGSAVSGQFMGMANVAGNAQSGGGHGVRWLSNSTNAIILNNLFTNVTFRGLSYDGTNGSVGRVVALKNKLSQGGSYHVKARPGEGGSFFLWQNTYLNSNGVSAVNAFIDYPGAPVHLIP